MQVIFKRVKRLVLVSSSCFCMTTLFELKLAIANWSKSLYIP